MHLPKEVLKEKDDDEGEENKDKMKKGR